MFELLAVDWSINRGFICFDGKEVYTFNKPEEIEAKCVLIEAAPKSDIIDRIKAETILICNTDATARLREELGYPKSDEVDAKVIWELYRREPSAFRVYRKETPIERMVRFYSRQLFVLEKFLNQVRNQYSSFVREHGQAPGSIVERLIHKMEYEKECLEEEMIRYASKFVEFRLLVSNFKGIGNRLAAEFVAVIGSLEKFTLNGLVRYCGVCVRRTDKYSRRAKNVLLKERGIVSQLLLKKEEPYFSVYKDYKERKIKEGYSKLHAERLARRKVARVFLRRFYRMYRNWKETVERVWG